MSHMDLAMQPFPSMLNSCRAWSTVLARPTIPWKYFSFRKKFYISGKYFSFQGKYSTWKLVIAPAPVEGGEVDPSDPVDGLGQHEDGGDPDDGHGGDAADVQVAEVEEVADVGKVSTDQTVDGVQWDGEEGNWIWNILIHL